LKAFVRPSRKGDAESLAPRLREADLDEIQAAAGVPPLDALRQGFDHSLQPMTVVGVRGEFEYPIAMFGAVRESQELGRIWLLGSDDIFTIKADFIRQSKAWFRHVSLPFKVVTNIVDMRNHKHIRWLRWCGVKFCGVDKRGPDKVPFLEFLWRVK
jgi:hypothetical protein